MELGNLKNGNTVLIHSAAGGVGLLAHSIAKRFGAYTIGTVGSPAKIDFLKKEGYDKVIVRSKNFDKDLKAALGERALNVIMECIGGRILQQGFELLAPQGRLVIYGSARYAAPGDRPNYLKVLYQHLTRPKFDPQDLIHTNKAILGFNLIWLYERVEIMHDIISKVKALELPPPHVGHRFTFEELPEAIRLFQKGETVGKVVVVVD
jgi:alcohol dehydrogenase